MIPYAETHREDAVEDFFCKKFEALQRHPMTDDQSKILIGLIMAGDNSIEVKDFVDTNFLTQVIKKRVEFCTSSYTIEDIATMFLAVLTESPGMAVMYVYYLAYWMKKNGQKHLSLNLMCERIFPMGFPSTKDLNKLWDEQKVRRDVDDRGTDNLLDYATASKSLI